MQVYVYYVSHFLLFSSSSLQVTTPPVSEDFREEQCHAIFRFSSSSHTGIRIRVHREYRFRNQAEETPQTAQMVYCRRTYPSALVCHEQHIFFFGAIMRHRHLPAGRVVRMPIFATPG